MLEDQRCLPPAYNRSAPSLSLNRRAPFPVYNHGNLSLSIQPRRSLPEPTTAALPSSTYNLGANFFNLKPRRFPPSAFSLLHPNRCFLFSSAYLQCRLTNVKTLS
ncbi:hypothetical protein J6590_013863 [Homalodisca vitripennis]|nr:hypothetical protein J6590_013863 [Homalodisca vitripennis]